MKLHQFCFLILFLAAISACNKPVYKYNKDFEGTWFTTVVYDSTLHMNVQSEIKIDGLDGLYRGVCAICPDETCACTTKQTGKAVMSTNKKQIKIGTSSTSYPLSIDEEPTIDSEGKWTMKIGGLRYYKI